MRFPSTIDNAGSASAVSQLVCDKHLEHSLNFLHFVLFSSMYIFLNFSHFHDGYLPSFSTHSCWIFELAFAVFVVDVANVEPLAFSLSFSLFSLEDRSSLHICYIIVPYTENSESKLIQVNLLGISEPLVSTSSVTFLVALPSLL